MTTATKLIIVGDETTQLQSIPKHFSPVGGGNTGGHQDGVSPQQYNIPHAEEVTTRTHGI